MVIEGERFSSRFSREYNVPMEELNQFFDNEFKSCILGKADLTEVIKPYLKKWNYAGSIDDLLKYWFEKGYSLNAEIIDAINNLKTAGKICILATNQEKYRLSYMRKGMGLENIFDFIFCSSEIGLKKSQEGFFEKIMEKIPEIKKEEVLFFDDREENIVAAQKFGFNAKLYKNIEDLKI
jgi:putative hydrolase of the HAD superfamily